MKKKLFSTFKNVAYSGVLCAGVAHGMSNSLIHKNNIDSSITQIAENYLVLKGINPYKIPARLLPEYQQKLAQVGTKLRANGRTFTDVREIDDTVRQSLSAFVANMSSVILRDNLDMHINISINQHMQHGGVKVGNIPLHDLDEYATRSANVGKALNALMIKDGRDYVRLDEVNKTIKDEFTPFIARLNVAQNNDESAQHWWTTFFSTYTTSSASHQPQQLSMHPTPGVLKIMRHELNDRTVQAAHAALRTSSINPNTIDSKYVADYAHTIQRIIGTMNDTMKRAGRNYVWQDELACEILRELHPLVQKIRRDNVITAQHYDIPGALQ